MSKRCNLCHRLADTVHWVPWLPGGRYANGSWDVVFACPDHDPGGYWARLDQVRTIRAHIASKINGQEAIERLDDRMFGEPLVSYLNLVKVFDL